jgi:uncharacterized membrane protein
MGPVQIVVLGFDEPNFTGGILAELQRLRDSEAVRLLDVLAVHKDEVGNVERLRLTDLSDDEAAEVGALVGALVGLGAGGEEGALAGAALGAEAVPEMGLIDEDLWYVDDAIPPGSAAAIALVEHVWATGLRDAIRDAGGRMLADDWIHPADLVAVGLLSAEEAASH